VQRAAEVERHRQVVKHHVLLGQREVVHHRLRLQPDVDRATHLAVDTGHRVLNDVAAHRAIGDGMQLAGDRIAFGMCGVAAEQCAAEIGRTNRFQLFGQFVRSGTCLGDGEGLAGVADDVGIGGEIEPAGVGAARPGFAELA
jgi:hypothetical protein